MRTVLGKSFFNRPPTVVARELLGKFLVRKTRGRIMSFIIVETEAYDGEKDLACHASSGRTSRTDILYRDPGTLYVYFVYGMHHMLNVVTRENGYPSAVLIRGVEGAVGPGRVTKLLGIDRSLNALEALRQNGLWFEDRGVFIKRGRIACLPRIGVEYAGPVWLKKPWRFMIRTQKIRLVRR